MFRQPIGPVRPVRRSVQRRVTRNLERTVHRLPGRARPPLIPVKRSYTPGQQRYIGRVTQRYVQAAARDRGVSTRRGATPVAREILRYGTGREKRALRTYFAHSPRATAQAKLFRATVLADARRRGVGAVVGGPSVDYGRPGVRDWNSPRAVRALHRALLRGNVQYQAQAGASIARALGGHTYDAAHSGYKPTSTLDRVASAVVSPRYNALAAATSGLYKNSALFRDLFDLPANTVTSAYNTGAGVVEALGGDSRRLRQLAHGIKEHDPVALLIQGRFREAAHEALQHPISTGLELSGIGHGIGRAAELGGRVSRGALARGVDYRLPGTGLAGTRRFSNHAAVRVVQRSLAERAIGTANQLRRDAARENTNARVALARGDHAAEKQHLEAARAKYHKAEQVDPRRAQVGDVQRWVDEHNAAVEDVRRSGRGRAMVEAQGATHGALTADTRRGRLVERAARLRHDQHGAIQNLYMQGIVHLDKRDLEAYTRELSDQARHLDGAKLAANVELRGHSEKALADPHFNPAEIRTAARAYTDLVKPGERELMRSGMLNRDAAERAPLIGYAVRRMGARHVRDHPVPDGWPVDRHIVHLRRQLERMDQFDPRRPDLEAQLHASAAELNDLRGARATTAAEKGLDAARNQLADTHEEMGRVERAIAQMDRQAAGHAKGSPAHSLYLSRREGLRLHLADLRAQRDAELQATREALHRAGGNLRRDSYTGLVGPDGRPLSNEAIRAHMNDPALGGGHVNPDNVIYLPQKAEAKGAANFYRSYAQRETHRIGSATRTGEAVRQGTFDAHPDTLVAHAANVQGLLDANQGFLDFYRHFGFKPHDPRAQGSYAAMKQLAADIEAKTGRAMTPIRIQPWGESADRLTAMLDYAAQTHFDEHGREVSPVHDSIDRALAPQSHDPGPFGLVDAAAAERLRQHMKLVAPITAGKVAQVVNQAFRRTVLPFSTKWITGNVVEAGLRTAIQAHFNPVAIAADYRLMRRVLAAHDGFVDADVRAGRLSKIEGDRLKAGLRARTVGGGHFEMNVRTTIHRTAENFRNTKFEKLAQVMGATARLPVARHLLGGLRAYTDWMMHTVNGTMERQFQTAQAGRAMRVRMFDRKLPVVQERAVADFAQGLRGTPAQVELGRMVDRAYGQYSKFGPSMRWAISGLTPFLAWTANAVKFLTVVLPMDHPVLTAVLAVNHEANRDWLIAHGLVVGQGDNAVPSWLLGTVPVAGGHVNVGRYTPFGVAEGDVFGSMADLAFPQINGFLKGLQGLDWKNSPVKGVNDREGRLALAFKQFAESNIPIYSQVSSIAGRKGSIDTKLLRQFDPFFPIQNTSQAESGGGSSVPSGPSSGWTLPGSSQGPVPSGQTWTLPGGP